ncbi:choice-of-anchor J domain-containing protein [Flavobacterium sp.]|uniref:choice-of-anchor J domain-containing protein n=1 Tax=Flavobacterium sp. TaxID=239 RepID=UPI00248898A6|nr:choice-of-anchor J domain-containing protein [Flavobacterium sp.]MDI1316152.1 choice-of-anchor J domain-containing protein [Flavobacterium sp.]
MKNYITLKLFSLQKKQFFVFIALLIFSFFGQLGFAQVSVYTYAESISSYTPLTAPSVAYAAPWDDHVNGAAFAAPLGFTFNYDGINQTQCYISPNGYLSFGIQPAAAGYLPLSVATPFTGGGTISALGMDLISATATDDIVFSTIGTAPNRIFVVQWTNARRKVATGNFNFQIRLNETSNGIEILYGICAPTGATAYNAQVGLRGVTTIFLQGDVNNRVQSGGNAGFAWSGRTALGTANSSTVRTSAIEYPDNGLLYAYTPASPCTIPTASPTAFSLGTLSVDATSSNGNSFTAASPAPTNYLILRSTVNTTPTNIEIPNRVYWAVDDIISGIFTVVSISNATSFAQTGLTPNTRYYYWIIPYNAGCSGGPFYKMNSIETATISTCIAAPTGLATANVDGNSFIASWTTVAGATDYQIDVSTSSTFATLLPAYTNLSTGGATSLSITGLIPLTNYYFRVRATGLGCGLNSASLLVSTLCGSFPIPYYQNFDTTAIATLPSCFTVADDNSDTISWQVQNTLAASAPNAYHLRTNSAAASNDWFFLPGLSLTGGVTYRLKFKYNTTVTGSLAENLRVRLGSSPTAVNMTGTLLNLANLSNTVYQTAIVDFTPAITDSYYLGFQGSSFANQSKILIDDISVIVSPTCFEPTNIVISTVSVTTATMVWNASAPPPANGYQYYVSTSNVQPSGAVIPTGAVGAGITTATISGLTAATLYYVWVRGNCSASDKSEWSLTQTFSTDCAVPALLASVNGSLCGGGSTTLTATATSGATVRWFSNAAATTLVGTGSSFVTPTLFATRTYYAQSTATGGLVTVGALSPLTQGGSLGSQTIPVYLSFTVTNTTTFQSLDIYPLVSGENGTLSLRNSSNVAVALYNFVTSVSGGTTPQTIPLGFNLTPGNYFIYFEFMPASGLVVNSTNATYPYSSSIASITSNDYDGSFYMYAYNWKFSNVCKSLVTPVTANISPAPPISFSSTAATLCSGETTGVVTVSGAAAYTNFVWSPTTGVSGSIAAGFTFNPVATTTYSLIASQTSGSLCASLLTFTVTVNPEPPAIGIVPAISTICQGAILPLNASLSTAVASTIFSENFNGPTNNWTTVNNSAGGASVESAWTLRNGPYSPPGAVWPFPISSNDNSQFYFTDSYAQGGPSSNITRTYLISPTINLAGYSSATFSFWQFLRYIGGNRARVEASTDGGTTWFTMLTQFTAQGTSSSFVNTTVDLAPLLGNPNVKLRFYYDATYDYGWAVDNVTITGTLALEVIWSPATELFFDAAATVPYIAGTPTAAVYTKPSVTRTYTGTALGSNGCSTSSTTVITVVPNVVPGTLSSNQSICGGFAPNNLVLTGATGTIVRWEYAANATFTSGLTTIVNTTSTLTTAAIGTFTGGRYYRVVLQSGSCPIAYSNSVLISFYVTTWDGSAWSNGAPNATARAIFAGNYSSTADLQACSVQVVSGLVTFNTNHTLTVQNDVKVTGGSLVFEDKSSLVQVNHLDNNGIAFANTGNITYKRTTTPMFRFDYTYWSSPVSPQNLQGISPTAPFGLFFWYNPAINNWAYVNPSATTMVSGRGYICRAPISFPTGAPATPLGHTANFIGVPNNGPITLPIIGGASQFNLLGNPYPSALSADAFLLDSANAATLGGTIYLWTHNTPINAALQYTGSDYAIYNYLGGVVGGVPTGASSNPGLNNSVPNGKIASGQGFFIKGLSNGTATFKNTMRIGGNNDQFFRMTTPALTNTTTSELEKHRYWLNIENTQGAFKQALIGYVEQGTLGLDRLFDGEMVDVGNAITLYTLVDAIKLSIQGRPVPFDVSDTIPLGYKSTINSDYTISLFDFDGLFTDQKIYLEDKDLNIIHDLSVGNYTFTTNSGTFDDRFVLRYTTETLGTSNPVFNANTVVIYKNEEANFVIKSGTFIMDEVTVFDVRGRLLLKQKNINATQTTFNEGMTNQVLLVQIKTVDGVMVTKKVVR